MDNHDLHASFGQKASSVEKYLSELVYGGIDGCVTTFAVVAGSVGAGLDSAIIIILGFANLFADGFSMSIGAFLSAKSQRDNYRKHKKIEYWEIENMPETEREEIREIYRKKGFEGELLEQVVDVITADKDRWVEVMMKDELELIHEEKSPIGIGVATYLSFLIIGFVPLTVYLWDFISPINMNLFQLSCLFTGIGFVFVGALKSRVNETNLFRGMAETFLLGTLAAVVAYYVGDFLQFILTN